jgi:hypothetical protein
MFEKIISEIAFPAELYFIEYFLANIIKRRDSVIQFAEFFIFPRQILCVNKHFYAIIVYPA